MSRWFRHYAGMMRDEKLVSAAVKAKQPVERVVWVWGAILESASEINDNGRYEFDAGEAAYFLRCDDADLVSILTCLESLGRLSGGVVVRWGDRQYSSDTAAERQRRYRERKSANASVLGDDRNGERDSDVTVTSRDGAVTPQETETETELELDKRKEEPSGSSKKPTRLPSDFAFPTAWRQWAIGAGLPSARCDLEFTKLTNWAANAPGSKGAKRDWFKAWQNWVLKAIDELPAARGSPAFAKPERPDHFANYTRELIDGQDRSHGSDSRNWDDAEGVPILAIDYERR